MRHRKRNVIGLLVISLILFAVEAGIWVRSTSHARSETDKQNILGQHAPSEIPAIAGIVLLTTAVIIGSIPLPGERRREEPR